MGFNMYENFISHLSPETLSKMAQTINEQARVLKVKERPKKPPRIDNVNHPSHYNTGKIEVIDAIEDWRLGFHEGNVVKYIARAKHKRHELEDLKKAKWYLDRRIAQLELESV